MDARDFIGFLTGMSGLDKTSIVVALCAMGYACVDMDEPARACVDEQGRQTTADGHIEALKNTLFTTPVRQCYTANAAEFGGMA